jgi:hypothetical protein
MSNACIYGSQFNFIFLGLGFLGQNLVTGNFSPFVIFLYQLNAEKYFQRNQFFLKDDFIKNILRRKSFYVDINGALD